jgi:glycine/D-amino acid oxidase-like deaminating enzyme
LTHVRVAIVGAGLSVCACAASFAAAGVETVLLEADRIGAGATASSPGLLRQDLDASFAASAEQHGLRAARHVWQGFRRASLDFAAALRRFGVRADLAPQDVVFFTRDGAAAGRLTGSSEARRVIRRCLVADAARAVGGGGDRDRRRIRTKGTRLIRIVRLSASRPLGRRGAAIHGGAVSACGRGAAVGSRRKAAITAERSYRKRRSDR